MGATIAPAQAIVAFPVSPAKAGTKFATAADEYYIQKEYKMRFWGPTKLEVSLVWLIGRVF